jgi:hypothetical protein
VPLLLLLLVQGCEGRQVDCAPAFVVGKPYCHGCYLPLVQTAASGKGRGAALAAAAAAPQGGIVSRCPDCRNLFCLECDAYIHEQLHNCPGCECLPPAFAATAAGGG